MEGKLNSYFRRNSTRNGRNSKPSSTYATKTLFINAVMRKNWAGRHVAILHPGGNVAKSPTLPIVANCFPWNSLVWSRQRIWQMYPVGLPPLDLECS